MSDISKLLGDVPGFLTQVVSTLEQDGIDVSGYELDHVCYRVETQESYQHFKKQLGELGELLTEAEIGGRPISTFRLCNPITFGEREIYCVELPSPKKGINYQEGLQHVEFVIDVSFEEFMQCHPDIRFNTAGVSKPINPDISVNYEHFCVKFHHHPLDYVIEHLQ